VNRRYQALIFDCFGVLCSDGWLPFKRKHFGHDEVLLQEAGDFNKQVDAGMAEYGDFIAWLSEKSGQSAIDVRQQLEANPPDEELFKVIKEYKPTYKLGILSNAGVNWLPEIFSPDQLSLFDATALSYETGLSKPNGRAYQLIAQRLGVLPEQCIFIDDQPSFVTAAHDEGMQAIVYQSAEQLARDLAQILD